MREKQASSLPVRPKLKQDAVFLQTPEGAFFQGSRKGFNLRGKHIYKWVATLAPHFNGEHTLEELTRDLQPAQRDMVQRLTYSLLEKEIIKNYIPEDDVVVPDEVKATFAPQIELIDHYVDEPLRRFMAFRSARVLLVGDGPARDALAVCLAQNGLRTINLALHSRAAPIASRVGAVVAEQNAGGVDCILYSIAADTALENVAAYDMIVFCQYHTDLREIERWHARCQAVGTRFLPAYQFDGAVYIGPLVDPNRPDSASWTCALLRLAANLSPAYGKAFWQSLHLGGSMFETAAPDFGPPVRILGNAVVFEIFRAFTGYILPETQDGIIVQRIATLESIYSPVLVHPLSPYRRVNRADGLSQLRAVVAGQRDRKIPPDELHGACRVIIDSATGAVKQFDAEELTQLPLKIARFHLSHPINPFIAERAIVAYSFAKMLEAAGQAVCKALRQYAYEVPDVRTLYDAEEVAPGAAWVQPQAITTATGIAAQAAGPGLPAVQMHDGQTVYVPAAAVYTGSPLNPNNVFERTTAGWCCNTTYAIAKRDGLLSALTYQVVKECLTDVTTMQRLDHSQLEQIDHECGCSLRDAQILGYTPTLILCKHDAPIHVVFATARDASGQTHVVHAANLNALEAVQESLRLLVGDLQYQQSTGEWPYAAPELPAQFELPFQLLSDQVQLDLLRRDVYDEGDIYAYLGQRKLAAAFVHTTPADVWQLETVLTGAIVLYETD